MSHSDPILVTGACGFVGATLCADLVRAGENVIAVDDLSVGGPESWAPDVAEEIELVIADIRDQATMAGLLSRYRPRVVHHLAAIHFIPRCEADPPEAVSVNVVGTQSLLTACARAHAPESVVLCSTAAVYAPSPRAHRETDLVAPVDVYGLTKQWLEQAAALFNRTTGVPVGIARLFNVIGPGETNNHLLPELIRQAAESSTLRLGNLSTRRDYIYVGDVAAGLVSLSGAAVGQDGPLICNLGAGHAVDGQELVRLTGELLGRELVVEVDRDRLRASDRPVLESDCTLAAERLGWRPRTSLRDALSATIASELRRELPLIGEKVTVPLTATPGSY